MKVVLITPALNEAASIGPVLDRAMAAGYPVIVVDDGSTDGTGRIARERGATVLRHPFNLGVGAALQTGFREALLRGADAVVQVDADGQHDVSQVETLVAQLGGEVQMVIGSRFVHRPHPRTPRGLAMRTLARRASKVAGTTVTDSSSGFRAIGRPLLELFARRFPSSYLGDTFGSILLACRHGYRVAEVPALIHDRQAGVPSTSPGRAAFLVLRAIASETTSETKR